MNHRSKTKIKLIKEGFLKNYNYNLYGIILILVGISLLVSCVVSVLFGVGGLIFFVLGLGLINNGIILSKKE